MRRFTLLSLAASLLVIALFLLASLPAAVAQEPTPGGTARALTPEGASPVRPGTAPGGWAGAPASPGAAISSVLASAISVAAGGFHTCALTAGGEVKCWGYNGYGQLGDGTTTQRRTPVEVTGLAGGVTAVAAGGFHTCALTAGGVVKCWGSNRDGQLGDGTTTNRVTPVDVTGLGSGVTAVAAGLERTCALTAGGGVKCWGNNRDGQLGDGTTTNRVTPVDVTGLGSGVTAVTTGLFHTCALTAGGEGAFGVKCWGNNRDGQLGDGTTTNRVIPVDVIGLTSGVTAVAAGGSHTCALTAGGGVKCWGDNLFGQLGDITTSDRPIPVDVIELVSGVSAVAAGEVHTCALTAGGCAKCWGYNLSGRLGDGTTDSRTAPVDVTGLDSGVTAVATGYEHTCALTAGGRVKCWGDNRYGQLGDGTTTHRTTPVDVTGLGSQVSAVAAGSFHTCVLAAGDGGAFGAECWGWNGSGQVGDATTTWRSTPVGVTGLASGVIAVTAGLFHTCALMAGGGVRCWGDNGAGQLGDGTTTQRRTPVEVMGLASGVIAVTAGLFHTCALMTGGGVKCWGDNRYGQLGDGTTTNRVIPVDVTGLANEVTAVTAGNYHTCALTAGSGGAFDVKCWGDNDSGQLGDGTTTHRTSPVTVTGLGSRVTAVTSGGSHTCALTACGGVKCWGNNYAGQLGDGTMTSRTTPVDVSGLGSGASTVTIGEWHTCALAAGEGDAFGVKCWGSNGRGQLGDGTTTNRVTPMDVSGLRSGVSAVTAGEYHTCALTTGGRVKCWGDNEHGQLGVDPGWTPADVIGFGGWTQYLPFLSGP